MVRPADKKGQNMKKYVLLVVGCAVSAVFAARTIEISLTSQTTVSLAFGPADGSAYQLYVGSGPKDSGGDVSDWQTFEKVDDIASDATGYDYTLPEGWGETVKAVRFFLVEPLGRTITSEWWRITFTKNVYSGNNDIQLGDLRFYSSTTDLQSSTDMAEGLTPGSGSDASQLARGKVITTLKTTTSKPSGAQCNLWDIRNAFDNSVYSAVYAPSTTALASKPQSVTWRLAEGKNSVQCYKVYTSYLTWYWHPCDWKVEVSDDGLNWTLVDQRSGQQSSSTGSSLSGSDPYIPNVPVVSSQSETVKAMNVLTVNEGAPVTIDAAAEYDEVYLRDKLTLAGAGTLTAVKVVVDGPNGGVVLKNGATWSSSTKVILAASCAAVADSVDVVEIGKDGVFTAEAALNENPDVAARILFNGGRLRATGFGGRPFVSENGAKWILEAVNGHDIVFGDLGLQRFSWLTGDGTVETRGAGNVIVFDDNYNVANDYRGTANMNVTTTPDNWKHSGDFVISNAAKVVCQADDCLPHGAQTGNVALKWVKRNLPTPLLDLDGKSVALNGLVTDGAACLGVTNSASSAATLVLGRGDVDGVVSNVVFSKGNVNLSKTGAGTALLVQGNEAGDRESQIGTLTVSSGTLVVRGASADLLCGATLTVEAEAELIVDGQQLRVGSITGGGTVTTVNGGKVIYEIDAKGSSDRQVVYDALPSSVGELFKSGSGTMIVQQTAPFDGDLTVTSGAVVFSGRQCTNEWYRWVLKENYYNDSRQLFLGNLYLYPDTDKSESLAKGLKPGTSASALARGQIVASFSTTTTKPSGGSCNLWDIRNLFDDETYNAVVSASAYKLSTSNQSVTFRLAEGKNRVSCYLPANSYLTWHAHPSAWELQTSADGVNWLTVDARSGVQNSGSGLYNGGVPYPLKGYLADGAAGLSESAKVSVASGASVDFGAVEGGQTVTKLEVDFANGGGAISNFKVGNGGALYLTNVPNNERLSNAVIPVSLVGVENAKNFATWTIFVNGSPRSRRSLAFRGGELVSVPDGACIIVR